jgi:hypothetical protein
MNDLELAQFLARLAVADNRQVDAFVLAHWQPLIGDLELHDAVDALVMHSRESTVYLMPAHIIENVKRIRDERYRATRQALVSAQRDSETYAPRPLNEKAMAEAWNDEAEFAKQVEIYNDQLRAEGFPDSTVATHHKPATRYPEYQKRDPDAWMQRQATTWPTAEQIAQRGDAA